MLWRQPKRTAHPLQWVFISSNYALSHSCSARLIFFSLFSPLLPSAKAFSRFSKLSARSSRLLPNFPCSTVNCKESAALFLSSSSQLSRNRKHQTILSPHLSSTRAIFSKSIFCQLTACKYASCVEAEDKLPQEPIRQAALSPWQQQSLGAVVKATGLSACLGRSVKCKCYSQTLVCQDTSLTLR